MDVYRRVESSPQTAKFTNWGIRVYPDLMMLKMGYQHICCDKQIEGKENIKGIYKRFCMFLHVQYS